MNLFSVANTQISIPQEDRRDDQKKLYNPMTIKELSEKMPGIPWLDYMNTILAPHHVLTEKERVNVRVPDYISKLIDLLARTPKRFFLHIQFPRPSCTNAKLYENRTLANYLMWGVTSASVEYVHLKKSEQKPRWKECTDLVSAMYVYNTKSTKPVRLSL